MDLIEMLAKRYQLALIILIFLFRGPGATDKVWAQKIELRKEGCVAADCHAEYSPEYSPKEYFHGPVSLGDCNPCHELVDEEEHLFTLTRQGAELCSYCHLEQALGEYIHEPLTTGDCMGCHDPHSSDSMFLIPAPNVSQLCFDCHEEVSQDKTYLHGPFAAGECTLCHSSHSSDYTKLLIAGFDELCFICHETTNDELKKFDYVHQPVQEKGCIECHDPHGTEYSMVLKNSIPELCYPCHEDIQTIVHNAKWQHDVVAEDGGCSQCHTPHASSVPYGLKADPLSLCLSCHDQEVETNDGQKIANFKSQIEGKKFLHGPVEAKDCESCHVSHGSDYFRLLIEAYPPQFYAPFDTKTYQLCFSCHPESRVLTKETTDLTDFRNGNSNLHFIHVNKPQRGRTCRACHATHASDHPKHISEKAPYGNWEIPIQFEKTETGGSCKPGCHKPQVYDRAIPVVYGLAGKKLLKEIVIKNSSPIEK